MKFATVAALALAATTVNADLAPIPCPITVIRPWILATVEPGKACFDATGFKGSGYNTPTQDVATKFCKAPECRTLLDIVVAAKPSTDCVVTQSSTNTKVNFYEATISVFVDTCSKVQPDTPAPTTPAPTTPAPTTPAPTTPAPTTPAPTTPAPTTPAPTTPAPTTPTPTTGKPSDKPTDKPTDTPTTKPVPTTLRPQC